MAEQFLNVAEVGTTVEQMGGGAVSKCMRGDSGSAGGRSGHLIDDPSCCARVESPSPGPENERVTRRRPDQVWSSFVKPGAEGPLGGHSVGNRPLAIALTYHAQDAAARLDVYQVQPAKFCHANTARVQQFNHHSVAEGNGVSLSRPEIGGA